MLSTPVQLVKQVAEIVSIDAGMLTDRSAEHPANADSPILKQVDTGSNATLERD
jgi:hypothetical protein